MGHPVHEQVFFIIEINKCVTMLGLFLTTPALGCAIKDLGGLLRKFIIDIYRGSPYLTTML